MAGKRFFMLSITALLSVLLFSCATSGEAADEERDEAREEVFRYVDAAGVHHKTILNALAPRNDYIKKCFRLKNGKMSYEGDERYTSRLGCDISRHDGKVDWQAMKEWGIEFVILRIGYRTYQGGIVTTDEMFHENYDGAIAAGLDVGVYFFSQAITQEEAIEEANRVIYELKGKTLQLPVVFDPENIPWEEARTDDVSGEVFTMTTKVFCQRIEEAGYKAMVYSNMIWESDMFDMAEVGERPIWYADYEEKPQSPYAFVMWQYSAFGEVPGCTAQKTDMDILLMPSRE